MITFNVDEAGDRIWCDICDRPLVTLTRRSREIVAKSHALRIHGETKVRVL